MRNYLNKVEIVGVTMCYKERDVARWSLDWLYKNCNRVCIILDNWDKETEDIVLEYKNKYPDITRVAYSDVPVVGDEGHASGKIKRRFTGWQATIRNFAIKELKKMHEEKPIDLLIWPDSDETFIDEFPKHLEYFWYNVIDRDYMVLGFIQVYDNFKTIYYPRMFPHARVFRYNPEMDALKGGCRCSYYPYYLKKGYKKKSIVIHVSTLKEEYRKRRGFFDNNNIEANLLRINASVWLLPKDVRSMTQEEIMLYNQNPKVASFKPISFKEYLEFKNNEKLSE